MKFHLILAISVLMSILSGSVFAEDLQSSYVQQEADSDYVLPCACGTGCNKTSLRTSFNAGRIASQCCKSKTYFVTAESTFFRYHRADGVRLGDTSGTGDPNLGVEFDYECSPRVTAGFYGTDGFGIRARWWRYDHAEPAFDPSFGSLGVDTYNIDLEFVDQISLTCYTDIELFAGFRYNDFDENFVNELDSRVVNVNSSAYGGLVGVQVNRTSKCGALFFARARAAVLMDDGNVSDSENESVTRLDTTQGMTEIASGMEFATCLGPAILKLTVAAEMQNWFNFSANFGAGVAASDVGGVADVGFGGLVVSASLEF